MATFREIPEKVLKSQNRRELLNYLVSHIEETFRPNGGVAKNSLLKEDHTTVQDDAFEEVVAELLKEINSLDESLKKMLDAEVSPAQIGDEDGN